MDLAFMDYKKASGTAKRYKLLEIMLKMDYPKSLVNVSYVCIALLKL